MVACRTVDRVAQELILRLKQHPDDMGAYGSLKDHYRTKGDYASLVNLIVGWARYRNDPIVSSDALVEAAHAVKDAFNQTDRAHALFTEALQRYPLSVAAIAGIQGLMTARGSLDELREFLSSHIEYLEQGDFPGTTEVLADLYVNLGVLLEKQLGDAAAAMRCFSRAAELNPNHPFAGQHGRRLAAVHGDRDAELKLRSAEATSEQDPERKASLFMELAQLETQEHNGLTRAIDTLRTALQALPGDVAIMSQLAQYLAHRSEQDPNEDVDKHRAAELWFHIATGLRDSPNDAIPYLESALDVVPNHIEALSLLEKLATSSGNSHVLPARWVAYLDVAPDDPESDARRLSLGRAYAQAGQVDDAIYCLQQLPPNHPEAAALLSSLMTEDRFEAEDAEPSSSDEQAEAGNERKRAPRARRPSVDDLAAIEKLHDEVHRLVAEDQQDEAAARCRDIIALDPTDSEAFHFLETYYRRKRLFVELRELLLASTRVAGLSVDTKRSRLLEVATISERKLKDVNTAIAALQSAVLLSSTDSHAARDLKRLLISTERWDEVVDILERETLSATTITAKVHLLEELAEIHRSRRGDIEESAQALMQLHDLQPDNKKARNTLCKLLVEGGRYEDAVPLLWERIEDESDERQRTKYVRQLLELAVTKLEDDDVVYPAAQALLALVPGDQEALKQMVRIDEARGDYEALVQTLKSQAQNTQGSASSSLYARIGAILDEHLDQPDGAIEAFGKALDASPENQDAITGLIRVFEDAGRYEELATLLQQRADQSSSSSLRISCYRHLAKVADELLGQRDRAAQAYEKVLEGGEDVEALTFLATVASDNQDAKAEVGYLKRLQKLIPDLEQRRGLLMDIAVLQRDDLNDLPAAIESLSTLLAEVDAEFSPAFELLGDLAEEAGDQPALLLALRSAMETYGDSSRAVTVAQRIADLCEGKPEDQNHLEAALRHWARCAPEDPEPLRRLLPLIEHSGDPAEVCDLLDDLASRETDSEAKNSATIKAARVASVRLKDPLSAWTRLQPLVEQGSEEAETLLLEICRAEQWVDRLANLHISVAQSATGIERQQRHWLIAANLLRKDLNAPQPALEAAIRALAADMHSQEALKLVDELTVSLGDFSRLDNIYERLVNLEEAEEDKVKHLLRHVGLLEGIDQQLPKAFSRLAQAASLRPDDDALVTRMEKMARKNPALPMLPFFESRYNAAQDGSDRLAVLKRAANYCEVEALDRHSALDYLVRALAECGASAGAIDQIMEMAAEFDRRQPELGRQAARRALVDAHRVLAHRSSPEVAHFLFLNAAHILESDLHDPRSALEALRDGLSQMPTDSAIYESCLRLSTQLNKTKDLEDLLSKLVAEAIDSEVTSQLLRWQAELVEGPLSEPKRAADIYTKLVQLSPRDLALASRWRNALKNAGRQQELLLAIKKQLEWTRNDNDKLALLREAAIAWDKGLRNRYEAIDAWEKVLGLRSDDEEAKRALARLKKKPSTASMEDLFSENVEEDEPEEDQIFEDSADDSVATSAQPSDSDITTDTSSSTPESPEQHQELKEAAHDSEALGNAARQAIKRHEDGDLDEELEEDLLSADDLELSSRPSSPPARSLPPPVPPRTASQPHSPSKPTSMPPPVPRASSQPPSARAPSLPPPLPPQPSSQSNAQRSMPPPIPPSRSAKNQNSPRSVPPPLPPKEPQS